MNGGVYTIQDTVLFLEFCDAIKLLCLSLLCKYVNESPLCRIFLKGNILFAPFT